MKKCTKCNQEKPFNNFTKHPTTKDGYASRCNLCKKEYTIEWQNKNKEKYKKIQQQYYLNNKEKINKRSIKYNKQHYIDNKELYLERSKQWVEDNRERINELVNSRHKRLWVEDSMFKMKHNIRHLIYNSFKRYKNNNWVKSDKTESILGCSMDEFIEHLKAQFKPGMTIGNHGEWEIDHIIPLSSASTKDELVKLNHYTNLQPLWLEENRKKGGKLNNSLYIKGNEK